MNISAETVKELRERTGAGMMDCKKALSENAGDMDKAIEFLRKQGLAKAAKKAVRTASEGLIGEHIATDSITMVEINCETDFVCKTDDFRKFVKDAALHISKTTPKDNDVLLNSTMNGKKVTDIQTEMVARIGENIGIRRFIVKKFDGRTTKGACYIHAGSKIGVIAIFDDPNNKLTESAAKDVAMHTAAMNPWHVRKTDVPTSVLEKEKEVYRAQLAAEKKPAEVLEKIVGGKLNKFLTEICLEDQIFVRDVTGKQSVGEMLKGIDAGIKIKEFVRYQVGEGIEKKKD